MVTCGDWMSLSILGPTLQTVGCNPRGGFGTDPAGWHDPTVTFEGILLGVLVEV